MTPVGLALLLGGAIWWAGVIVFVAYLMAIWNPSKMKGDAE